MPNLSKGQIVAHRGKRWRVVGIVEAVGGAETAQIDCIDEDAAAAVAVSQLDPVQMAEADVEAAVAERERRETPKRLRHKIRVHQTRMAKWQETLGQLVEARDEARRRLTAGDLRPIENRVVVPGQVLRIAPEDLVRMADDAVARLEARIAQAQGEAAQVAAQLRALEGGG